MKTTKQEKDKCVNCKRDTLYNKEEHIDFRLGYIQGVGQLCLDCYGVIYGIPSELQNKEIGENKNGFNQNH